MARSTASIIIRCYNEGEHIDQLLHGIFNQRMNDFEVLLVDSGSTDGTLEIANRYPVADVVHIDPEEFSFGRALNYGCEAANGEYYVFASAHVYPKRKTWLETLLEKFDDSDVALVYGKQRGNEMTEFSEQRIFDQWFPDHDIDHQDTPFCNNANAAIRAELWEEFPYNEELTGLEDLDWAKRVQRVGYEISYASEAEIVHVHDETAREIYNRYRREAIAYKQIMPDQQFGFTTFLRTAARNIWADFRAAINKRKFLGNIIAILRFRLLQMWGTYRGSAQDTPVSDRLWRRFYYPDADGYPSERMGETRTSTEEDLEIDYSDTDSQSLLSPTDNRDGDV